MDQLSNEQLIQLKRKAELLATKWGYGEYSEDFAQEALIVAFERGPIRLERVFIDFLRKQFGSSRSGVGRLRQLAERYGVRLDAPIDESEGGALKHDLVGTPTEDPITDSSLARFENSLRIRESVAFRMMTEGYTQEEIGNFLGITSYRVCQIYGKLKYNAKAMIEYWAIKEQFEDKEIKTMEVQWITL